MNQMSIVTNAYVNNNYLGQTDIVDLLVIRLLGTLHYYWDKRIIEDFTKMIRKFVENDDNGVPIFDETIRWDILDGANTLIYSIVK